MKINLDNYLGSKPFLYGRDLLKRIGAKQRYVNEYDVAEFLGYEIKEINDKQFQEFKQRYGHNYDIGNLFDDNFCAVSIPKESVMLIYANLFKNRKRLTIFHESGHEILPWHIANAFSLRGRDIDPTAHKQIEREAFLAGTEIMYPLKHFIDDSRSLALSFQSINSLSDLYNGSFEATGIRYALTNHNIMAIVVVKENTPIEEQITFLNSNGNGQLVFPNMPKFKKIKPASTAPLRVQYCSHAHKFPKFIKSGTEIEKNNLVYECWSQQRYKQGEIPASVFGSSAQFKYFAECVYYQQKVFVLLWLTDRQIYFGEGWYS